MSGVVNFQRPQFRFTQSANCEGALICHRQRPPRPRNDDATSEGSVRLHRYPGVSCYEVPASVGVGSIVEVPLEDCRIMRLGERKHKENTSLLRAEIVSKHAADLLES